jgi:hypothetical protein
MRAVQTAGYETGILLMEGRHRYGKIAQFATCKSLYFIRIKVYYPAQATGLKLLGIAYGLR